MSEQEAENSPMRTEVSHRNASHNDTFEDGANNSIIGKVKSRVSSIFPNSLSKWFSPSTKNSDSLNGSLNSGLSRRRRRIEVEDDDEEEEEAEEEEDEDDEDHDPGEYDENLLRHQQVDENFDDESNNSEESANARVSGYKNTRLRTSASVRQPPSKRSRLNVEVPIKKNARDTPLMQRQQLVASTPAVSGNARSAPIHTSAAGRSANRFTHLNLYGNQGRKEPAFNFVSSPFEAANATDIGLATGEVDSNTRNETISSRRSLNISSTTQVATERYCGFSNLKRQSLSSVKHEFPNTPMPRRTSTTIFENESENDVQTVAQQDQRIIEEDPVEYAVDEGDDEVHHSKAYNGREDTSLYKKQKLSNGILNNNIMTVGGGNVQDSSSESGDGGKPDNSGGSSQAQRNIGLHNMSAANSRNGSRTSSFGNGLNFYSHLEGRKSLFAGSQAGNSGPPLNNSTLSLTSLNRRQFNASIYGSTSALSDSRLLNTFSPFYKGKTTYGGAAAYNKYQATGVNTGAGASAVRITPTLIRPTSSLSTLSSSNNSLAAVGNNVTENTSAISSTAKRILDLINDFATPLSEAKKMASNLKTSQQQLPQSKTRRFNETDLNSSRAVRLSQVRTPYMRPSVTLQPTTNANGKSNSVLPPVRELQVPSMSQLLQMKKMQCTTERSRQIATEKSHQTTQPGAATQYSLPIASEADGSRQQKHTNKIKNKVTSSVRITGSKDASAAVANDGPLEPVNLPNIAFPLMQSVPKFDIPLPTSSSSLITKSPATEVKKATTNTTPTFAFNGGNTSSNNSTTSPTIQNPSTTSMKTTASSNSAPSTAAPKILSLGANFKFSTPLQLEGSSAQNLTPIKGNYKFSLPILVNNTTNSFSVSSNTISNSSTQAQPQLKTGSVLDALKKPFTLPTSTSTSASLSSSSSTNATNSLASQFKKSSSEWECDTCMIRNKQDVSKCVACETPRKLTESSSTVSTKNVTNNSTLNAFGSQFKKSSEEWECSACMIRNKKDVSKCVACETPREGASSSLKVSQPITNVKNSFGDAFKPKANTWECSTCLINNKSEANECVACQTKKPSAGSSFTATTAAPSVDAGFKSLVAAQTASKWECEACMTRNDASKQKCVCCEQAKPGSQAVGENVPKFSFGSTAAAKFSFGFGAASNAPKEEELRKNEVTAKKTETPSTTTTTTIAGTGFVFGSTPTQPTTSTTGAFSFGIKPVESAVKADAGKDTTDVAKTTSTTSAPATAPATASITPTTSIAPVAPNPVLSGFKFGATPATNATTTSTTTQGFVFGAAPPTTTTAKSAENSSTTSNNPISLPSVKFSLPTTSASAETQKSVTVSTAAPTFSFGSSPSSAAATFKPVQTPAAGFSFGLAKPVDVSKPVAESATSGFSFKPPATTTSVAASTTTTFTFGTSSSINTTSTMSATPAPAKPLFSFGSAAPATSSAAPSTSTSSTKAAGGFSFGSSPAAPTKTLFGATTTTASVSPASVSVSSTTTAQSNVFGSFGGPAKASPVFGAAPSVSSSTPPGNPNKTFGSLGASAGNSPFGSFGSSSDSAKPKTTATTSLFGTPSNTGAAGGSSFVFGSTTTANSAITSTAANPPTAASTTTWPKNSFVFGSASSTAPTSSTNNETPKSTFGGFGSTSTATNNATPVASSIFGNIASASSNSPAPPTFGSAAAVSSPIFGSVSATAAETTNNRNLFGSAVAANSSAPAPAFGTSPFGNSSSAATPTFGSAASSSGLGTTNTFGGFGATSAVAASTDGASAAKKSEPAFNFGGTATAPQSTTGGFNFGAAAAPKPAFNFGASTASTASFNFTGSSEPTKSAQPFQFGATPSAPVFNFSSGAVEATPNAPFQFNAGAAPPASNIFAPTPTPGAQTAQQARRKIRAPMRRLTPR